MESVAASDELAKARRLVIRLRTKDKPNLQRRPTCGLGQLHRHRTTPGRRRVLFVLCKTWQCKKCRAWLISRWEEHLTDLFQQPTQLHVVVCTRSEWDARIARKINRTKGVGGGYARLTLRDAGLNDLPRVVITTAPVGDPITTEEAVTLLHDALAVLPAVKRAVSTSRTWKLPVVAKTHEWDREEWCSTHKPSVIRGVLEQYGVRPIGGVREIRAVGTDGRRVSTGASTVEFEIPEKLMSGFFEAGFHIALTGSGDNETPDDEDKDDESVA